VDAQDLVFGVVPGVLGLDRASGTLCVRVATNAPHGFRLTLLRDGARPMDATPARNHGRATTRSARGESELPYRVRAGVMSATCAEARSSQLPRAETLRSLGADGLLLVDASGPVSDGDVYEVAVAVVVEAGLDGDAGTFLENLHVLFEPRYR
jgi:hypothetical protein